MSIILDNCTFFDNKASGGGGAVAVKVGEYSRAWFLSSPTNILIHGLFSYGVEF